jgi:predicted molibdopterin-dependent oxidoreductase YjgC
MKRKGEAKVPSRISGAVERGRPVELLVDGQPVPAFEGESIAAALLAADIRVLRTTARFAAPRGLYCGMGVCFECVMRVDGRANVRTCQTPVRNGMHVESQRGEGA